MNELVQVLPKEVLKLVADSRKKSYLQDAIPNYPTTNPFERGFTYSLGRYTLRDVSVEQDGVFYGKEEVIDETTGKWLYVIRYAGGDLPYAHNFPKGVIAKAQHGLDMRYPHRVRFGAPRFEMETEVRGHRFLYTERSSEVTAFGRVNKEIMYAIPGLSVPSYPVFEATSQLTIFKP